MCRHCDPDVVPAEQRIATAGPTQVGPIAKGLCGPGLLAHVVTAKFADHTPVHRLAGQLARSGVTIASSTLGDWLFGASELLTPLYELMHTRLLMSRVIHGDDTGVKLRVPGSARTKKAHLWVSIGDADYASNNWDALKRYLERGFLALDNNLSERTLRVIALGRNNWGVIGSAVGGQTAAVLYSVVGTCKHLGVDPFAYLRDALPGVFTLGEKPTAEQLLNWLPDRWLLNRMRNTSSAAATG